jgi:hypothetical protein
MDCPADGDEYNDADENIEKDTIVRTTVIVNGGVVKFKRRQLYQKGTYQIMTKK